jgi:hypothetical protein
VLKDKQRLCDVCGEDIPKGAKYRKSTMSAQDAGLPAASDDPDMIPTWMANDDGTVTMEICLTRTISMDTATGRLQLNAPHPIYSCC